MQFEQKREAYRVETLLTGVLNKCFDQCVKVNFMSEQDLTSEEALCIDMCSWKYMHTHKALEAALARSKATPTGAEELKPVRR